MGRSTYQPSKNISFHRRLKATIVVLLVWSGVSLLHWLPETQWLMLGLTAILTVQTLRMLLAKPAVAVMESEIYLPPVSILVPAKNESPVLANLVYSLCQLNYPSDSLDIWVLLMTVVPMKPPRF